MSALSAAASDEDGDIINTLRAENEMLRQSLLAMHNTLEMTAKAGAHHARAAACLRETVIRWASRAEQAENLLEAIGAGGVGNVEPSPAVKESLIDEQPPAVEQEPVAAIHHGTLRWHIAGQGRSIPRNLLSGTHLLYVRQQPRQPMTTEMADLGWELHGSSDAYQAWHLAVEWTERAHGIGGEA